MSRAGRKPVTVGVAGVGDFGLLHAHTLAGLAEAELVALVDRRADRLSDVAKLFPAARRWDSLDRALAECEAEARVIASSTAAHVSTCPARARSTC